MKKALFLDRDGVINVDKHHVFRKEDFEFIEGIFDICLAYQADGFLIFVVTNQAGIAKKIYSEQDFSELTGWMLDRFRDHGVEISKVYYCPHHPDYTGSCDCRKPKPGLIARAAVEYDIDLSSSVMIGDRESDIAAARNAGIKKCLYIHDVLS